MPHITIQMIPGRDDNEKMKMAQDVYKFLSERYRIDGKALSVSILDVPKDNWNAMMKNVPSDTLFVKPGYEIG